MSALPVPARRRGISLAVCTIVLVAGAVVPLGAGAAEASPRRPSAATPTSLRDIWPVAAVQNEAAFVNDINRLRAGRGLAALRVRPNLTGKARQWATTMAAAGTIWHSRISNGITLQWQKLGENVGMGASERHLHAAFVASGHHLENLLDPTFRYIGVGVVFDSTGKMFVSEVFMQPPAPMRLARAPERRTAALRATAVQPTEAPPALPPLSTARRSVLLRPAF